MTTCAICLDVLPESADVEHAIYVHRATGDCAKRRAWLDERRAQNLCAMVSTDPAQPWSKTCATHKVPESFGHYLDMHPDASTD